MRALPYTRKHEIEIVWRDVSTGWMARCESISESIGTGQTPFDAVRDLFNKIEGNYQNMNPPYPTAVQSGPPRYSNGEWDTGW